MTWNLKLRQLEAYGFGPNVMKKTKVCRKCGQVARTGAILCRACLSILPRETLYDSYKRRHPCCTCGTVLRDDVCYCPQCGRQIRTERET